MRKGFTIVEVLLFLAITGLMIVGLLTGIGVRVAAQRYNDAVQDIDDYLTRAYSEVINVENSREDVAFNQNYCNGYLQNYYLNDKSRPITEVINVTGAVHAGRSRCAIYGKLVTFGEPNGKINMYTVIGQLESSDLADNAQAASSTIDALMAVGADVFAYNQISNYSSCSITSAGVFDSHSSIWDSTIEKVGSKDKFQGAVLIVRSPISGTVHTYRLKDGVTFDMEQHFSGADLFTCNAGTIKNKTTQVANGSLMQHLKNGDFIDADLDICINSPDLYAVGGRRRNIRILADGRNASAVKLVDTDVTGDGYKCGL